MPATKAAAAEWIGALVTTRRSLATIAAVLLILIVGVGVLYAARAQEQPARAFVPPSSTPSATIPIATSTPVATAPATTAPPSPTIAPYVNAAYKFSVTLPAPSRKSVRLSLADTGAQRPAAQDAFTARTDADEAALAGTSCQTICPIWNYVAVVIVYTGAGSQTPRQWYASSGGSVGETIEDTTVDGRQAIKVTNGATYPLQYFIKDGDRMFRNAYSVYPDMAVPAGASKEKLESVLTSFRFTP